MNTHSVPCRNDILATGFAPALPLCWSVVDDPQPDRQWQVLESALKGAVVIAGGAEVAALGRVVAQVSSAAVPSSAGGPADVSRRSATYSDFSRAALAVLAWSEMAVALQQAQPSTWRATLAAATAVAPAAIVRPEGSGAKALMAFKPVALTYVAGQVAENLDFARAMRNELTAVGTLVSNFISAHADVRLFGNADTLAAADNVAAVLGELLQRLPTPTGVFHARVQPTQAYNDARDALGHYLRLFSSAARVDLARLPWRRRLRLKRRHIWRPKPAPTPGPAPDAIALVTAAKPAVTPTKRQGG